ncbi:hypothetical protein C8A03DRAFT_38689 [Achaetomium macrosporum]|uniref:Uncharacterized protein n=1 Tax=Achaetomium macrosporum TaxID=79813 RepID=A0AAN7C1L9_9PEZI|nr:hypothetical protein C8A03DRAFT_38689 [Achaetomium macrosporum]
MYIVPLSLLLPTFALAVALPSTPTTPTTTIPYPRRSPYALKITDFHSICAASACYWEFNVTAPAGGPSGMPAFTASGCIGTTKDGYKECDAVHSAEQQDETEGVGKLVNGSVEVAGKEENLGATVGANVWVRVAWVW